MLCQRTHPNVAQILMTSLTGRLVDKLTFAFKNTKSVNFSQNIVRFIVQVMTHRWHQKLRHCFFVHY